MIARGNYFIAGLNLIAAILGVTMGVQRYLDLRESEKKRNQ